MWTIIQGPVLCEQLWPAPYSQAKQNAAASHFRTCTYLQRTPLTIFADKDILTRAKCENGFRGPFCVAVVWPATYRQAKQDAPLYRFRGNNFLIGRLGPFRV